MLTVELHYCMQHCICPAKIELVPQIYGGQLAKNDYKNAINDNIKQNNSGKSGDIKNGYVGC